MSARAHIGSIAATVQELAMLATRMEAQISALGDEARCYLEAVHTEKQEGDAPELHFACTKKAEMDALAVRFKVAYQDIAGIGNDLRRRAP